MPVTQVAGAVAVTALIGSPAVPPHGATGPGATGLGATGLGATGPGSPVPPDCSPASLRLTLGAGSSDGRHGYLPLIVTSTSASACRLSGYPGVQFVAANGRAVGLPARRLPGGGGAPVLLTRAGRATSRMAFVLSGQLPVRSCRPQPILGIRVYLPGAGGASFLRLAGHACSTVREHQLSVTRLMGVALRQLPGRGT